MLESVNLKWKSMIISCLVSLVSIFFTQFTLFLLHLFLPTSSFLILIPLSALLLVILVGLGRCAKKTAGVKASAPAFVFFTIFFIWAVYIFVVRHDVSYLVDIVFNTEIVMVLIGLCRILASDPGFVTHHSDIEHLGEELKISTFVGQEESQAEQYQGCTVHRRVRYCRHCKTYVLGFDHHCPAFGNCIGQKNHAFFMMLLIGFLVSEVSYVTFAYHLNAKSQTLNEDGEKVNISKSLVLSTMSFALIQVLWQVIFIMWHVYCACFNIKTDEWINWRKYPEFQIEIIAQAGQPEIGTRFINPYNKGILRNLKEFLTAKG